MNSVTCGCADSGLSVRWNTRCFRINHSEQLNNPTKSSSSMHLKHSPPHSSNELNYLGFFFDHLNPEVQTLISYSEKIWNVRSKKLLHYVQTSHEQHEHLQCIPVTKTANQQQVTKVPTKNFMCVGILTLHPLCKMAQRHNTLNTYNK